MNLYKLKRIIIIEKINKHEIGGLFQTI
jgi:hypothetical protein